MVVDKQEIIDKLLKYIYILLAVQSGWTVKMLNDKTFEFRKKKTQRPISL
jgi:hypothetical protein